jgi:hypothetical protein
LKFCGDWDASSEWRRVHMMRSMPASSLWKHAEVKKKKLHLIRSFCFFKPFDNILYTNWPLCWVEVAAIYPYFSANSYLFQLLVFVWFFQPTTPTRKYLYIETVTVNYYIYKLEQQCSDRCTIQNHYFEMGGMLSSLSVYYSLLDVLPHIILPMPNVSQYELTR